MPLPSKRSSSTSRKAPSSRSARTAFIEFLDATKNETGSSTIDAMRLKDPDKFLAETRGRMRNFYSSLSKGVHAEYIIPLEVQFDRQTVVQYLRDSVAATTLQEKGADLIAYTPYAA